MTARKRIGRLAAGLLIAAALPSPAPAQERPPIQSDQPIEISADSLEVQQDKQVAIFRGNVDALQGSIRLNADQLKVYYRSDQAAGRQDAAGIGGNIVRIDAIGQVRIASPTETARGDKGVYDVADREITLTGNVVLTRGPNVIRGESLVMNMDTGRSRVESGAGGRVRGIFVPPDESETGEEQNSQ